MSHGVSIVMRVPLLVVYFHGQCPSQNVKKWMIIRGTPMTLEYFGNLHLSVHFKSDPDLYTIYIYIQLVPRLCVKQR